MPTFEGKVDGRGRHGKAPVGVNHPRWKGDNVGYGALHSWIVRQMGRATRCEDCGKLNAKKYEWANISKQYKRDVADWKSLCTSCHRKFDNIGKTGWNTLSNPHCVLCKRSDIPYRGLGQCQKCYWREYSRRKRGYYSRL